MPFYPHSILFIRHGQTDYNAEGRLQGQRDIALNGKGREQANAVGRSLAKSARAEIDALEAANAFVASPLIRTRETMELARAAMGLAPGRYAMSDALKELTFGQWEGLTWADVDARFPARSAARERDKWNFTPPGGESYAALTQRIAAWLALQSGPLFLASHGGVARALMHLQAGLAPRAACEADIWQGRALAFDASGAFEWVG